MWLTDSFGPSTIWCWLNHLNHRDIWFVIWSFVITFYYIINLVSITFFIILSITRLKLRMTEIKSDSNKTNEVSYINNMILILKCFPILLVLSLATVTIAKLFENVTGISKYSLFVLNAVMFPLQGLFDTLLYSYFYNKAIKSLFCCN